MFHLIDYSQWNNLANCSLLIDFKRWSKVRSLITTKLDKELLKNL